MKRILLTLTTVLFINFVHAQYVNLDWATGFGDTCFTREAEMAIDNLGNIVVAGNFRNSGDFNSGSGVSRLVSNGQMDGYVTKLDSIGNHIWSLSFGSKNTENIADVAIDGNSNIYITGYFQDTVDFDPGPGTVNRFSNGLKDIFILKLDAFGNFVWVNTLGGATDDAGISIEVDGFGDIVFGGNYNDSIDANPGPGVQKLNAGGQNAFLLKLNSSGSLIWAKGFQGSGYNAMESMTTDASGDIYCTGLFHNSTDFDPGPSSFTMAPSFGWRDIFIVKLDKQGAFKWAKNVAFPSMYPNTRDVIADKSNGVYITGVYEGTIDFDPGAAVFNLTGSGITAFILKLNSNGLFEWAKSIGSSYNDEGVSMALNSSNDLITTGFISGSTDLDPGPGIYSTGPITSIHVPYILKLNDKGNFVWARVFKVGAKEVSEIYVDKNDDIFLSGTFDGVNDFDPSTANYNLTGYDDDAFVLKLKEGSCADLTVRYDSVSSVTCSQNSFVQISAISGIPPYTYSWNTTPAVNDSILQVSEPGFYTVTISDSSCTATSTILLGGPNTSPGFDLAVNVSSNGFRTGLNSKIWLSGNNNYCDSIDGDLLLILDSRLNYQGASPTPSAILGDTLIWSFTGLRFDSPHVKPEIIVMTDTSAGIGDTICIETIIRPLNGDLDTSNNQKTICLPVINSFDPNDKQVYPQGICEERYTLKDSRLTYTVRFQNTGNAPALNVYIIDTLSQYLDLNSLQILSSSHHMYTEVLPGNTLKFAFDDINLPDSLSNPSASQGYVIFEVSPDNNIPNGSEVFNTAVIYFDFNEPIITNTTLNTMVAELPKCLTTVDELSLKDESLLLYPNPTRNKLNVYSRAKILNATITDITGKTRYAGNIRDGRIDVKNLESGIYFITIQTEHGWLRSKFVKN